ncbi:MAG TPA: ATPase [Clostridiales bacterium]|nr:ATPase [Clostridiales bacterium]
MKGILVSSIMLVALTILTGVYLLYQKKTTDKRKMQRILRVNLFVFLTMMILSVSLFVPNIAHAVAEGEGSASGLGFVAVALSTGLATLGAGYAVGAVGSAALGAVSEDPGILGKTLIFVGLAEGIAIYGLIISILILGRI